MPEDFDPFSRLSEEQTRAVLVEMMSSSALDNVDTIPEVETDEKPPQGDSCCEDLKMSMLDLVKRHGSESLLLVNDWISDGTESCEEALEFLNSAIDYGIFLIEDGGGYLSYDLAEGEYATEKEAKHAHRMWVDSEQGQLEKKVLAEMRQILAQYELCQGTKRGFGDVDHDMFYASADPFEYSWNLIIKELGGFE
jgi:hypothetical protein